MDVARCEIDGCTKPTRNRRSGMCHMHYYRVRRHGTPEPGPSAQMPLADRFWRYVDRSGPTCWLWTGHLDRHGYGRIGAGGRNGVSLAAHRVSYELQVGPIPHGLDLDHLCRNPRCVNPAHLDPVTRGENTRRGTAIAGRRAQALALPTCKHGHRWTPENTYHDPQGRRRCRTCMRANDRQQKEMKRVRANPSLS